MWRIRTWGRKCSIAGKWKRRSARPTRSKAVGLHGIRLRNKKGPGATGPLVIQVLRALLRILILLGVLLDFVNKVFAAKCVGFAVPGVGDFGVGLVVLLNSAVFVHGLARLGGRLSGRFFGVFFDVGGDQNAGGQSQGSDQGYQSLHSHLLFLVIRGISLDERCPFGGEI